MRGWKRKTNSLKNLPILVKKKIELKDGLPLPPIVCSIILAALQSYRGEAYLLSVFRHMHLPQFQKKNRDKKTAK